LPDLCQFQKRLTKYLVFFPALIADQKVLLYDLQSFGDWPAEQMKFRKLGDVQQAGVAVDLDGFGGPYHVEHFLDFMGS